MKHHLHPAVLHRLGYLKNACKESLKLKHLRVPAIKEQPIEGLVLSQRLHSAMGLQLAAVRLEVVLVAVVVVVARSAHKQKLLALLRLILVVGSQSGREALLMLFSMLLLLTPANQ